jgi:hypothetical protein
LQKYGLTADDWDEMCRRQNCTCPVCNQSFGDRMLVIDHDHVRGFKATKRRKSKDKKGRATKTVSRRGKATAVRVRIMTPAERRAHVRGVLHAYCNGLVRKWLTLEKCETILAYLIAHNARRAAATKTEPEGDLMTIPVEPLKRILQDVLRDMGVDCAGPRDDPIRLSGSDLGTDLAHELVASPAFAEFVAKLVSNDKQEC